MQFGAYTVARLGNSEGPTARRGPSVTATARAFITFHQPPLFGTLYGVVAIAFFRCTQGARSGCCRWLHGLLHAEPHALARTARLSSTRLVPRLDRRALAVRVGAGCASHSAAACREQWVLTAQSLIAVAMRAARRPIRNV